MVSPVFFIPWTPLKPLVKVPKCVGGSKFRLQHPNLDLFSPYPDFFKQTLDLFMEGYARGRGGHSPMISARVFAKSSLLA